MSRAGSTASRGGVHAQHDPLERRGVDVVEIIGDAETLVIVRRRSRGGWRGRAGWASASSPPKRTSCPALSSASATRKGSQTCSPVPSTSTCPSGGRWRRRWGRRHGARPEPWVGLGGELAAKAEASAAASSGGQRRALRDARPRRPSSFRGSGSRVGSRTVSSSGSSRRGASARHVHSWRPRVSAEPDTVTAAPATARRQAAEPFAPVGQHRRVHVAQRVETGVDERDEQVGRTSPQCSPRRPP